MAVIGRYENAVTCATALRKDLKSAYFFLAFFFLAVVFFFTTFFFAAFFLTIFGGGKKW